MKLEKLSVQELEALQKKIPGEIAKRKQETISKLRETMAKLAAEKGFALHELVGNGHAKTAKRKPMKGTPRVDKNGLKWSGLGRPPKGWDKASARAA